MMTKLSYMHATRTRSTAVEIEVMSTRSYVRDDDIDLIKSNLFRKYFNDHKYHTEWHAFDPSTVA